MNDGKLFRIYPTNEQEKILSQWIGHQRFIYNSLVQENRYYRTFSRKALSLVGEAIPCDQKYSQFIGKGTEFLKDVPSQILRNGAYRWYNAYQRFFKKVAKGRPTIKKRTGRQSVLVTKELFTFYSLTPEKAMIRLGTKKHPVGDLVVRTHAEYTVPNSISISVHGGQWHVSFSNETTTPVATEAELLAALQHLDREQLAEVTTGFDRNVVIPVAASDGTKYDYTPGQQHSLDKAAAGKKRWQRRFSRRDKDSANRRKAVQRVVAYDRQIRNIRKDFAHKTSHAIVNAPGSLLVFEDLQIKNMTASAKGTIAAPGKNIRQKAGLNRAILHSCWGTIKEFTSYKGLKLDKVTIVVPAHHSSQECSQCGYTHKDNRTTQSEFVCQACGYSENADFNASLVIKKRGVTAVLEGTAGIKVPKTIGFTKSAARRAGAARTDASASTPVERLSVVSGASLRRNSQ